MESHDIGQSGSLEGDQQVHVDINVAQLRHCVVRVRDQKGSTIGTGFFAAPGYVLTCAHVVDGFTELKISPAMDPSTNPPLDGTVVARSHARDPLTSGDQPFWPFPDLAIIHVPNSESYGCVLIENVATATATDLVAGCSTWGYPQRADERDPDGDTATFSVVGPAGPDAPFTRVRGGWVGAGISGAPVATPDRGAVIGVLSASLDPRHTDGGWFTPLAELREGQPGVPEELVAELLKVLANGQSYIIRRPERWTDVVRLVDGGHFTENMAEHTFKRQLHTSPAELLLPDNSIVEYLFNEDKLRDAEAWAVGPDPVGLAVVSGVGGVGKSRLAIELSRRLSKQGWVCGDIRDLPEDEVATLSRARVPRLLVVDYAENETSQIDQLLQRLLLFATAAAPARVLLLTRDSTERGDALAFVLASLRASRNARVRALVGCHHTASFLSDALTQDQQETLYDAALKSFAAAWDTPAPDLAAPSALPPLEYAHPLTILLEALDAVLRTETPEASGGIDWSHDALDRVLEHERRFWDFTAPKSCPREVVSRAMALLTLCAGDNPADLIPLIRLLGLDDALTDEVARWAGSYYPATEGLAPLRPDKLGERLVACELLRDDMKPALETVLLASTPQQAARALEVLSRCASQPPQYEDVILTALENCHEVLARRARTAVEGKSRDARLARSMINLFTGHLGQRLIARQAPDQDSPTRPELQ